MPTPYDGKVGLWHVSGGWVGEPTIEALCQTVKQQCPVADRLNRDALSLPSSVELTAREQERVIQAVRGAACGGRGRQAA